jgi:uncharacterized protein (DUF1501 family)
MPIRRRDFIKQTFGAVSVAIALPDMWASAARANTPQAASGRRVLVVIELSGGNDGLNTVAPYTDPNYLRLRPNLALRDTDFASGGASSIISDRLALHPAMTEIKQLYDAKKVAIVLGVGYPDPNGSHFISQEIWQTANINEGQGDGWLGRYLSEGAADGPTLSAISINDRLPKALLSRRVVVPNIPSFDDYGLRTDPEHQGDHDNKITTFAGLHSRQFPAGSFIAAEQKLGSDAVQGAIEFRDALRSYSSAVTYPNTSLAEGLQMLAQVIVTIPAVKVVYVETGGFDNHSDQIAGADSRTAGQHANLLGNFSEAVMAFYRDMEEHGLADGVLMLQTSEFGRRPNQNNSLGTDHGTANPLFVIGNPVKGGLYGEQPGLGTTQLDGDGNLRFGIDFRSVYGTILDKWLSSDSRQILNSKFDDVGFLG